MGRIRVAIFVFLALAVRLAAAGPAPEGWQVRFEGVPERGLKRLLQAHVETYALRDRPPPTERLLRRRAEEDLRVIRDILFSAAYYGADPTFEVITSAPRRVIFHMNAGPRYRIGRVELVAPDPELVPTLREIGLHRRLPARADTMLAGEQAWITFVRRKGYPFAQLATRRYRPDHEHRLLHARLVLDPGPYAVFGDVSITGAGRVRESFIRGELGSVRAGTPFDPEKLDEARSRLIRLGVFSSVFLVHEERVTADGSLPLRLSLRERRPRTVAFGARYATDEGYGLRAEGEHRNLGGRAERLSLTVDVGESLSAGEARLALPQFGRPRQRLVLHMRGAEERADAYESRSLRAGARLERDWRQTLGGFLGAAFRLSDVGQFNEDENYVFASVPAGVDWNTSGDLLDPKRGSRVRLTMEPFFDLERKNRGFFKAMGHLNRYFGFDRARRWVLAARVSAGSIYGSGTPLIPADERFYAGGGGSVRGYAYQSVGPLRDKEPIGGRSLLETSAELRAQLFERFGVVAFVDGGSAYAAHLPDFEEPFRWGTGFGIRYYTPVGPLRADLAFPIERRAGIDKPFQFYISLGQAF